MKVFLSLCVLVTVLSWEVYGAQLTFSNTLGNNMVLQREPSTANIWGWANPNDAVKTTFRNENYAVTADKNGAWLISLKPTPAGGPYTITVTSSSSGEATLSNVLFGDVYLCGGQSNMQFTVCDAFNATQEIAEAANFPQIRVFTVGQGNISSTPENELLSVQEKWSVASAVSIGDQTIGMNNWTYFSAVCWFYGKYLTQTFPKLPIGLISSNCFGKSHSKLRSLECDDCPLFKDENYSCSLVSR
eukprot:TRINITY_DN6848_c1_g1_i1.p1 TRINITY_DN6848_c1_g1~~TRINITY_DN6848_c1_g1_i1.p1  ORF type:complete len:245 (+),score=45.24 TRINITY_DN6848_c1_g1_i1:1001-1735(+)